MKVLVVSGFLGAGKTTFIKALAQKTKREIAILENEYAHVGVDGDRLKNELEDEKINIWELTEGCICCSTKKDFASSILTIANSIDPEILVVEPTGVAKLSNVMESIKQLEYERISVLPPITIVDGYSFDKFLGDYPSVFKNQLLGSDKIVVSKFERADTWEKSNLAHHIQAINGSANIYLDHYSSFPLVWWQGILEKGDEESKIIDNGSDKDELPENFSINNTSLSSIGELVMVLEALMRGVYGDIIRAKGSLEINGEQVEFDVVEGRYSILMDASLTKCSVIFIGKGIQRQRLRKIFLANSEKFIIR